MPGSRPRLSGSLALAAASAFLTLLVLEAGLRLAGVGVGTVQINRETVRRSDNPRLRFELRPGSVARAEVVYRINDLGLRGRETTIEKPPGTRRVAVLGDSIAFGYWVEGHDAFPQQLEAMLEPLGKGPVEVLDFGVPGYNLDQQVEVLRSRALAFSPDVVAVAFCLNDLEGVFSYELGLVQDRSERRATLPGRLRDELLRRSRLFSWVEYRLSEREARQRFVVARNPFDVPLDAAAVSRQRAALSGQLARLRALLEPRGVPALVAVFPVMGGRFERYPHRALHEAVVVAAEENGLGGLDLLDCYSAYDFRALRVDVVHPSPLGHRVAAHAIRDALCARGWACEGGAPAGPSCRDYRPEEFPAVRGY